MKFGFSMRSVAGALVVSLVAVTGHAGVFTFDANFAARGQSMWESGDAGMLDVTEFVGLQWNESTNVNAITGSERTRVPGTGGTIPNPARPLYDAAFATCRLAFSASKCRNGGRFGLPPGLGSRPSATIPNPINAVYVDTRTGGAGTASTSGRVGFEFGLTADSGSVDSDVDYEVSFTVPDSVAAGEFVSLQSSSSLTAGALDTTFPTLASRMSLVAEAQAGFTGQTCFVGFGCDDANASTGQLGGTFDLVSFNQDGEGGISYFEDDPILNALLFQNAAPPTGLPASVSSPIAELTTHLPQPNASGGLDGDGTVRAAAQDDLVDFLVDVDNIVSLGLTGTPNLFGAELDMGAIGTVSFDLVDVDMGPTLDLRQAFEFTPSLYVDLAFSQPVDVLGFGRVSELKDVLLDSLPDFAFDVGQTLITPTLFLGYEASGQVQRGVQLMNELFLDLDGTLRVDVLDGTFSFLNLFDLNFGIGNVFDESIDLFTSPALF